MKKTKVTPKEVAHISQLAQIPVSKKEGEELAAAFEETLAVVDELQELDVENTPTTHQVTGMENVWREDVIDKEKMFSQKEALANSDQTHQGYFVVNRILEEKDA